MKKFYLIILFVATTIIGKSQSSEGTALPDSSFRVINISQTGKQRLEKLDETVFTNTQKADIINYINTLSPRVTGYNFSNNYLYVSLEPDFKIVDLLEGIKVLGISLVYYDGSQMYFVNDDLKIETWTVK